jgi:hypothetical protein
MARRLNFEPLRHAGKPRLCIKDEQARENKTYASKFLQTKERSMPSSLYDLRRPSIRSPTRVNLRKIRELRKASGHRKTGA